MFFADQIVDGVGTAEDNLALKEEEEKQRKARIKKLLPKNGGNHFRNFPFEPVYITTGSFEVIFV